MEMRSTTEQPSGSSPSVSFYGKSYREYLLQTVQ